MKTVSATIESTKSLDQDAAPGQNSGIAIQSWALYIFLAIFAAVYIPVILETAKIWATDDNYSHGFLVAPCTIFLVWMQRERIKTAVPEPTLWGVIPLAAGLLIQVAGYILTIKHIGMLSIVPTLVGAVLLLHGPALLRYIRFPIFFLLFAAPFSGTLLSVSTATLQLLSSLGATTVMSTLGFAVLRHGNVIEVPGCVLEIANACSGFHSIISMLAFTFIYAYLFTESNFKRAMLLLLTIPTALVANILRISVLVAAATYGGMNGYHELHGPAAIAEVLLDFVIIVLIGRSLGCNDLRFVPYSA